MSSFNTMRIEVLNRDNYDTWRMQAEALLLKNDAWGYVCGTIAKPSDPTKVAEIAAWENADKKARADLILSIHTSELKQIKSCATSNDVWLKLESIYQSKGPARKATLLKQLMLQKMKEGEDVRTHIAKFFDAVDKLQSMGIEINEDLLAIMLLYSLPANYENFRCAIESRDELPSPDVLRVKIIEENDARKEKKSETAQNAMIASKVFKKDFKSRHQKGSTQNFEKHESKENFKYRCYHCKKIGHKAADCYFKARESKQVAKKIEEDCFHSTVDSKAEYSALTMTKDSSINGWCLDSGCTSHMCNNEKRFVNMAISENEKLNLANCASTKVEGKGTVKISTTNDTKVKTISLQDTLYVPDLRTDLISVTKITNKGYDVIFQKDKATIMDDKGNSVITANLINGLYYVQEQNHYAGKIMSEASKLTMWHERYGHLNEKDLKEIVKKKMAYGIEIERNESLPTCEVCIKGKLTRSSFQKKSTRKTNTLEIIHTDVCGPMRTQSHGGAKYFMVMIDDKTRWCEVRFLKQKSDALEEFKKYKQLVENQTGKRIKYMQSDNGKEYCNKEFDDYLNECGIKRRLTVTHTPEQNGIAERRNRTLTEMARCMLIQSNLPPSFWAEAISTANYIRNRCPSKGLYGYTPFRAWTGKYPGVSHFRTFGCKVLTLDRTPGKGKFQPRSKEGIFIGYSSETKGYRIWLPNERKVDVARDVKFLNEFQTESKYEDFVKIEMNDTTKDTATFDEHTFSNENNTVEIPINTVVQNNVMNNFQNYLQDDLQNCDTSPDDDNEEIFITPENTPARRGAGRPRLLRDGRRGRPKKVYQPRRIGSISDESDSSEENACIAEVPLEHALQSDDKIAWKKAINSEFIALIKNNTWKIVDRPNNCNLVSCRMVLRNKCKPDGTVDRRKARLVARGFSQREGIDYNETYAPVARLSSIRTLMALSVKHGLTVEHLDVSTAFLNGELDENVYMEMPHELEESLEEILNDPPTEETKDFYIKVKQMLSSMRKGSKVCLLKKALYGLKQSSRLWNIKLDKKLRELGFKASTADPCVYYAWKNGELMLITIYVDDILIACKNAEWMKLLKRTLMQMFEMRDLGKIKHYLGIQFAQREGSIQMTQKGYVDELLKRFGMYDAKPVSTPCDPAKKLTKPEEPCLKVMQKYPYRELIGCLMYLAVATRPDLAYTVSYLSQFCDNYGEEHWLAAKRVLRYLKGNSDYAINFKKNDDDIQGFVDADWAGCNVDRRSYTGFVFIFAGAPICWESRKQSTVALSSTEAEYMALTEATKEAIHLQRLLKEIGVRDLEAITLFNDNQGAQKLARNPVFHRRTKHVDVRHHFIRDAIRDCLIETKYMASEDMMADILTKGLNAIKHKKCLKLINLYFIVKDIVN